jgi:pimeloyl-ACP methyl ester carboxylesterase
VAFVDIVFAGEPTRVEYEWVGAGAPLLVFLHEGLGSLAMWKDFPARLCAAVGCRGLVYSRPGYGRSSPHRAPLAPDFMHRQAHQVLPALLSALHVDTAADPPWLFGHSDGGSIALLHAARFPEWVAGLIVLAPHIVVEALSLRSIAAARDAFAEGDLRARLARYHDDVDGAFRGWNDIWLQPDFAAWTIEEELAPIRCPLLAVQGLDDAYGTLEQIRGIARHVPHTQLLELPGCGHSPQRDQPEALIDAAVRFLRG